eukprot:TRINITY_DN2933_c0_g1_i1.p1 TRINITY_DN2933_c0_g1~~TRINITY_DN2933_c0_g1_i1.p1  ORF type:complete len:51 (-),score=12.76 TRINITY_DN2933_c0_g1_i1:2-154(-)
MGTLKGYADAKITVNPHTALDLTLQLVKGALELKIAGYGRSSETAKAHRG